MNEKEAQKVLDELQGVRPEKLTGEAKRLFKAIMVIADGRDRAYKIIDLMAETINNFDIDEDICKQMGQKANCNEYEDAKECKECIKQYFINKEKEIR